METKAFETPALYGDHHVSEVQSILKELPGSMDKLNGTLWHTIKNNFEKIFHTKILENNGNITVRNKNFNFTYSCVIFLLQVMCSTEENEIISRNKMFVQKLSLLWINLKRKCCKCLPTEDWSDALHAVIMSLRNWSIPRNLCTTFRTYLKSKPLEAFIYNTVVDNFIY